MSLKASTAVTGARVASRRPTVAPRATVMSVVADVSEERVRLHNLTPLKGSRPRKLRIGRGYGAGQGGSCGDGYVILGRDSHRSRALSIDLRPLSTSYSTPSGSWRSARIGRGPLPDID